MYICAYIYINACIYIYIVMLHCSSCANKHLVFFAIRCFGGFKDRSFAIRISFS